MYPLSLTYFLYKSVLLNNLSSLIFSIDLSARRVANHFPMSGGSSGGMSVSPVGFLILHQNGNVDFVNVENKSLYQTISNMVNSLMEKIDKSQKEKNDGSKQI